MNRTLLIRPGNSAVAEVTPPLGLLYLAAVLRRERGAQVRLLDLLCRPQSVDEVVAAAREFAPDWIGFSALSRQAGAVHDLSAALRRALPTTPQVLGGAYATAQPEHALDHTAVDYCVMGEGEQTLVALLDALARDADPGALPGVALRRDGRPVRHAPAAPLADLDALPLPAFELADFDALAHLPRIGTLVRHARYFAVFSSRGCPYHCCYCHNVFGKRFRARGAAHVLQEIDVLRGDHGVREIQFIDDSFNLDRQRVIDICRGLVARDAGLALSFPNGLRGDVIDEEVVDYLARAGTYKVSIAIETASPRLQQSIGKRLDLAAARNAIAHFARRRVMTHGFFMLGFPGETLAEMRQTARFARDSRLHSASFFFVQPLPGSPLAEQCARAGLPTPNNAELSSLYDDAANRLTLSQVAPRVLRRQAYRATLVFYLRPDRLLRILRDLPNRRQFAYLVKLVAVRAFAARRERTLLERRWTALMAPNTRTN